MELDGSGVYDVEGGGIGISARLIWQDGTILLPFMSLSVLTTLLFGT